MEAAADTDSRHKVNLLALAGTEAEEALLLLLSTESARHNLLLLEVDRRSSSENASSVFESPLADREAYVKARRRGVRRQNKEDGSRRAAELTLNLIWVISELPLTSKWQIFLPLRQN